MISTAARTARARVAMFVLNDMRLDSRVRREAATLAANGYDVVVYCAMSDATANRPVEEIDGYRVRRMPILMRPSGQPRITVPVRSLRPRHLLAAAFVATRPAFGGTFHLLANWHLRWGSWARRVRDRAEPADVWHAHDFNTLGVALACARRHGGAVVYDSHELFLDAGAMSALPRGVRKVLGRIERRWASATSAVVTVNRSLADRLAARIGRRIEIVHNCATPPPRGAESPLRARIGALERERVVVYHGSVTNGRGLDQLVRAFDDPRLSSARLVVMGYGPLRPRVQALARASPARGRIHLLPPVPPAEVTTWISGADVAAMPIEATTLNHRLSSPNKLFEAIAAGTPIVGPDFVEFRRIVIDGPHGALGRLHANHAAATIADAIHGILGQPDHERRMLRARVREAARSRWNWGIESAQLLRAYAALPVTSTRASPAVAGSAAEELT